jgi:hypothetical protein
MVSRIGVDKLRGRAGGLSTKMLDQAAAVAKADGIELRALCVINPGNPPGPAPPPPPAHTCLHPHAYAHAPTFAFQQFASGGGKS